MVEDHFFFLTAGVILLLGEFFEPVCPTFNCFVYKNIYTWVLNLPYFRVTLCFKCLFKQISSGLF